MKNLATALAMSMALAGSARADEAAFQLSKGFATGGFVAAGAGPVITVVSTLAVFASADNAVSGDTNGILAGGAGILIGVGVTALGPPLVVGSAFAGYLAVKDMGGSPSIVPVAVGAGGFGLQAVGWVLTITGAQGEWTVNDNGALRAPASYRMGTYMRWIGWTTELVGGGIQLTVNGKNARSTMGRTPRGRVALVPMPTGGMLVGQF